MPARRIFRRVSPSCRWLSSCATMPCSSSRVRYCSAPCVTASTASSASQPAAKALMASARGSTMIWGRGMCAAMHSSSTTLHRRCSACDTPGRASRAPTRRASFTPPARRFEVSTHQPPSTSSSDTPTLAARNPAGYGRCHGSSAAISSQARVNAPCTPATSSSTARAKASSKRRVSARAAFCRSQKRMPGLRSALRAPRAPARCAWLRAWARRRSPAAAPR